MYTKTSDELWHCFDRAATFMRLDRSKIIGLMSDGGSECREFFAMLKQQSPRCIWSRCTQHRADNAEKAATNVPTIVKYRKEVSYSMKSSSMQCQAARVHNACCFSW